jgi:hypothetical protein
MGAARRLGLVLLFWLVTAGSAGASEDRALAEFARAMGLRDVAGFVETVQSLEATGRLPARYLTKRAAEGRGWHPGEDLCDIGRGLAIGGDVFRNLENRLPRRRGRVWHEADLDFACGRRGAKRLLYSDDGLRYVTIDHYRTFRLVPE